MESKSLENVQGGLQEVLEELKFCRLQRIFFRHSNEVIL